MITMSEVTKKRHTMRVRSGYSSGFTLLKAMDAYLLNPPFSVSCIRITVLNYL